MKNSAASNPFHHVSHSPVDNVTGITESIQGLQNRNLRYDPLDRIISVDMPDAP